MGAWGTKLYEDDTACDLRDAFRELVRLPESPAELRRRAARRFGMGDDPKGEEETGFWLALADQFHRYGLEDAELFDLARDIIVSGADLAANRALGMDEGDLKKREKVLAGLLESWASPHPKPRTRKTIKGPDAYCFEVGDCYRYPTQGHSGLPYTSWEFDRKNPYAFFSPDGWGAFVVFDRWRYDDYYARYLIAVLYLEAPADSPPTLETCRAAPIDGYIMDHWDLHYEMVGSCYLKSPKRELKLLQADHLGQLPVDAAALRATAETLKQNIHGHESGDNQLGGLLSVRAQPRSAIELGDDGTRHEPCRHMPLAKFLRP